MRRFVLCSLLIFASALSSVKADIVPPGGRREPDPPPPPGPEKAVIRGVTMGRGYGYWQGRRWLSYIDECASSQPGCKGKDLHGCLIIEVDGREIPGGDMAFLQGLEKSAGARQIKLTLRGCEISEIELGR
jgi:hypothetical protein